jgi:ethanolamine ammonia-lyase large subunit
VVSQPFRDKTAKSSVRYHYGYLAAPMNFDQIIGNVRYTFGSLRELLARATPLRSGDVLAGVAARSAEERMAAQFAWADVPLQHFLSEHVVTYEVDEVTRLIADTHDAEACAPIRSFTVENCATGCSPVDLIFQSIAGTEAARRLVTKLDWPCARSYPWC